MGCKSRESSGNDACLDADGNTSALAFARPPRAGIHAILTQIAADKDAFDADVVAERAASQALSLAQKQYSLGGVSYITVLTTETAYQRTLITLIEARAARLSDSAALFVSLGGGWWNRHDNPVLPDRIVPLDGSVPQ